MNNAFRILNLTLKYGVTIENFKYYRAIDRSKIEIIIITILIEEKEEKQNKAKNGNRERHCCIID